MKRRLASSLVVPWALAAGSAAAAPGYTPDIQGVLQGCSSNSTCHSSSNRPLGTLSDAQANIDDIISRVSLDPSASGFMPPSGTAMDAGSIQKLRDWKAASFPATASGGAAPTTTATGTLTGNSNPTTSTATNSGTRPPTGTGTGTNPPGSSGNPNATGGNPTPLVLDLKGDHLLRFAGRPVAFDVYGTGVEVHVGWPEPSVGFLFNQASAACVTTGRDLFGDATPLLRAAGQTAADGFAALAQYDANGDGVIDAKDPVFARLAVWIDRNGDGRCTPDEVVTLSALRITALHLSYTRALWSDARWTAPLPLLVGSYDYETENGRIASRMLADLYLPIQND